MTPTYQQHLNELHARQRIPAEVLNGLLRDISQAAVVTQQRIIAGEVNEVYDIGFADGLQAIVRISRAADARFAQEQWAIQQCQLRGIPVPEVLGIWQLATADQPLHVCAQRRLDGIPLANAQLPTAALHAIVQEAGALLSTIHTIPVTGFGYLNGQGEDAFLAPEDEAAAFRDMEAELYGLARRVGISRSMMSRALRLIADAEPLPPTAQPCLTHNDFAAKHILVANGAISGIIDFGEVAGSEPLSDFVRWDYYDSARLPLAWLQEGYANKQLFDEHFNRRLQRRRIGFSLWVMRWYDIQGYAEGVAHAHATFVHDLAQAE